jgi:hypothetical protein
MIRIRKLQLLKTVIFRLNILCASRRVQPHNIIKQGLIVCVRREFVDCRVGGVMG